QKRNKTTSDRNCYVLALLKRIAQPEIRRQTAQGHIFQLTSRSHNVNQNSLADVLATSPGGVGTFVIGKRIVVELVRPAVHQVQGIGPANLVLGHCLIALKS